MSNVTTLTSKHAGTVRQKIIPSQITRIYLLGSMRALGPTGENILPRAKKAQAVLAYLCLAQGKPLSRSQVAGVIWDRSGERPARDSLRHALSELDGAGAWPIETDRNMIRLDGSTCWIDAFDGPDRADLLLESLYGISPAFDEWVIAERAQFENRWRESLERELNDLVANQATPQMRAAAARKLLNLVPTHEEAMRTLMRAFVEQDDRAQAIREYERFRGSLQRDLGIFPSEKTVALYEAIRLQARVPGPNSPMSMQLTRGASAPLAAPAVPGRDLQPSIAVLPFRVLSGRPGQEYLAEGLAEDLTEVLSRVPGLFVTSRLSVGMFQTHDRSPRDIGEALGVRYVLLSSLRVVGERVRLVVELTDTEAGKVLWISKFDEKVSNLQEMQSCLAETVVRSVAPYVRSAELRRVRLKKPDRQDAYELLLRGQENMRSPSRAVFEAAQPLFEEALALDPDYALARAWLAHWYVTRVGQGWSPDWSHDAAVADRFARRAAECDPSEPMAFAVQGHVAAYFSKDFTGARTHFETALRLNPNAARAWLWSAYTYAWMGEGERAVEHIKRAMALSPYDPLVCIYSGGANLAYLADGQYARSIEFALRCLGENRGYTGAYKGLILALVLSGREAEARGPAHQLRALEPGFTVGEFRARSPACTGRLGELYCDALARAGVPV